MRGYILAEGLLLSAVFLLSVWEGLRLRGAELVTKDVIGPGYYILGLSALLLISVVFYLIQQFQTHKLGGTPFCLPRLTVLFFVCLGGYAFMIPWLGYMLSSVLFFFAVFYLFGFRAFPGAFLLALLFAAMFHIGFVYLAKVPFPEALLWR